jgi:hypothetical protein
MRVNRVIRVFALTTRRKLSREVTRYAYASRVTVTQKCVRHKLDLNSNLNASVNESKRLVIRFGPHARNSSGPSPRVPHSTIKAYLLL